MLGFLTSWPVCCGCSLLLIYVLSLCLRAPRKIDSSIGLPSLNKVVTYLLNGYLIDSLLIHHAHLKARLSPKYILNQINNVLFHYHNQQACKYLSSNLCRYAENTLTRLSYDVASWSEETIRNNIDKPLVVYRF